jgi:predicted lipoprotein with Yx(FWY)xxD motif
MKRIRVTAVGVGVVVAGIAALVVAVSSGMASTTKSMAVRGNALSLKQTPLGDTLVAANGRTLYLFEADKQNASSLSRAGLAVWPAFTSTRKPHAGAGVSAAHIGMIAGPNGTRQVTYYGHPLYYYVGDQKPGETNGQGLNQFGAPWYVVSSRGNAVTRAPSTAAPAPAPSANGSW